MTSTTSSEYPTQSQGAQPQLMGLAVLMSQAYAGVDLRPLGIKLAERANNHPTDANALMDLSTIMQLTFSPDIALELQAQALELSRHYRLPATEIETLRVLALMAPGELMANAPLEFLLQDSGIALEMYYLSHELPVPTELPEHDVLYVAINESDVNHPLLKQAESVIQLSNKPVLNTPDRIARLSRQEACELLKEVPGMVMPSAQRVDRETLLNISSGNESVDPIVQGCDFPVIVRPVDSHAGHGLCKVDDVNAIGDYLKVQEENEFYLSPFIDYSDSDGYFRKYRVVLIDGKPFACHMAISTQWMVHYLNAYMTDSADKRAEEARFMETFDEEFAKRHAQALQGIVERVGLDYLIIDCAETRNRELLVFEIDSGAVVHDMDSATVFPYKKPQMRKLFTAFREMLAKAAHLNPSTHE